MAVPIDKNVGFRPGEPEEILTMGASIAPNLSLAPFGERFLATRINLEAKQHQIRVMFDWAEGLKEIAAGN
jgi:hypothetical protein